MTVPRTLGRGFTPRRGKWWPDHALKRTVVMMFAFLLALNGIGWISIILVAHSHPMMLGLAVLAYGFGLRHAVDPDHIAAIDNSTRKLVQEGQQPAAVGFFFSLGHSTVVVVLSIIVAVAAAAVHGALPAVQTAGSVIGTSVSCLFLLLIGLINLVTLCQIFQAWRRVVHGEPYETNSAQGLPYSSGLFSRALRSLFGLVRASWHMYPIGFLFGLGFDTATEIALLGLSATSGATGMPLWSILLLPLLFTAGMSLVDSIDGLFMLRAYGWAQAQPARKLYYNLTITVTSVVIAFFIGGVEGLQAIQVQTGWSGGLWGAAGSVQINSLGFFIVGAFIVSWLISIAIYRIRRYDLIESVSVDSGAGN